MADNKAPLGGRLVAFVAGVLALVLVSGAGAALLGVAGGWVWRCMAFGWQAVQP